VSYHRVIDGPVRVVVPPAEHPKVPKGGNHAADIATRPGEPIYAPADGKIPHVGEDQLDGGKLGGTFFTIDLTKAHKSDPAVRFVLAHVNRTDRKRAIVKAGEQIGTASGDFVHLGSNLLGPLEEWIGA